MAQDKQDEGEDINEQGIVLPHGMSAHDLACKMSEVTQNPTPDSVRQVGRDLFEAKHYFAGLQLAINVARHQDNLGALLSAVDLLMEYTTRYDIVIVILKRVLHIAPFLLPCHVYLARAYFLNGDIRHGTEAFYQILRNFPNQRELACENIGGCLLELGYFKEAYAVFQIWRQEGHGESPTLVGNIACALSRLNRLDEAKKWYEKGMQVLPHDEAMEVGYALNLFKMGLFKEGFPFYRRRTPRVMRKEGWFVKAPRLEHLADAKGRKICLYHEQGLGDALQFIRFLPRLIEAGGKVTLCVPYSLQRLFAISFPDVSFCSMESTSKEAGHFDYTLPIPDLPFICGLARYSDLPDKFPYLFADRKDVKHFASLLPRKKPRIGIVWSGQNRFNPAEAMTDRRRSVPFEQFIQAITPVDASLVSLQFGERAGDLASFHGQEICNLMPHVKDMADTAAIISSLDLIISVDTSVVHLAGALDQCPVWLISRWDSCWRWGRDGRKTPWYPNMTIFRPQVSEFKPVLKEIGAELAQWVKNERTSKR